MHATTPGTPSFDRYGGSAPENYERYFVPAISAPLAGELLRHAALQPGERVLDLACGTGIVARMAAERVAPTGSVAGVDVNPGMLSVARAAAPDAPIEWYRASAEAAPLPDDGCDVVLCQMGLQFFPDRHAALGEARRVLAAGGRLVTNLPGPTPPAFEILGQALGRHIQPETAKFIDAVFSMHDTAELHDLLEQAGFTDVAVDERTYTLTLPPPQEFLWQYVHATPLAEAVANVDEDRRDALQRDVVSGWQPFTLDGRLVSDVRIVHAVGWNA